MKDQLLKYFNEHFIYVDDEQEIDDVCYVIGAFPTLKNPIISGYKLQYNIKFSINPRCDDYYTEIVFSVFPKIHGDNKYRVIHIDFFHYVREPFEFVESNYKFLYVGKKEYDNNNHNMISVLNNFIKIYKRF